MGFGERGGKGYLEEELVAEGGEGGVGLVGEGGLDGGEIHWRRRRRSPAMGVWDGTERGFRNWDLFVALLGTRTRVNSEQFPLHL